MHNVVGVDSWLALGYDPVGTGVMMEGATTEQNRLKREDIDWESEGNERKRGDWKRKAVKDDQGIADRNHKLLLGSKLDF